MIFNFVYIVEAGRSVIAGGPVFTPPFGPTPKNH